MNDVRVIGCHKYAPGGPVTLQTGTYKQFAKDVIPKAEIRIIDVITWAAV